MGEFRGYLFTGNAWQKYAKRNGIGAGNQANWLVNGSTTRETGFCGFDHAITGAIYLTFHNGEKSSLDRPNYTSIQVFYFKISVKKKRRKQIRFEKQNFFFVTSIQFVACALGENLSNRSSGVQIPRDICTRFGRYLYSRKCSWIIKPPAPHFLWRKLYGRNDLWNESLLRGWELHPLFLSFLTIRPRCILLIRSSRLLVTSLSITLG